MKRIQQAAHTPTKTTNNQPQTGCGLPQAPQPARSNWLWALTLRLHSGRGRTCVGTMIRHAFCDTGPSDSCFAQPVSPLPISMVEPPFQALLVPAPSNTPLLELAATPANQTAVTLSPITVCADEEEGAAICSLAKSLTKHRLCAGCHWRERRPLDSHPSMMATCISLIVRWLPSARGHQRKTPVVQINRGFLFPPAPHTVKIWFTQKVPPAIMTRLRR